MLFWVVCLSLLAAWRWEGLGGAVSVLGLVGFYLVEWVSSGSFPRGWALALMAVPGVLFLLFRWLTRARDRSVPA